VKVQSVPGECHGGRNRLLFADIPAELIRDEPSTRALVRVSTEALNRGLRPHHTRWQARFRNWYAYQTDALCTKTPQEVQKSFQEYEALVQDLLRVNRKLIQYAGELQKIVRDE